MSGRRGRPPKHGATSWGRGGGGGGGGGRGKSLETRDDGQNGFGAWGGYMAAKKSKLEHQFKENAAAEAVDGRPRGLFEGVGIYVNGYTDPSSDELKRIMMMNGGIFYHYPSSRTTHYIATNLPDVKMKALRGNEVIVTPNWITESLACGKLLDYKKYLLYTKQTSNQPKIQFGPTVASETGRTAQPTSHMHPDHHPKDIPPESGVKGQALDAKSDKFLSEFYNNSRLHLISTMAADFKKYVSSLRSEKAKPWEFPDRSKLQEGSEKSKVLDEADNRSDCAKVIAHVDMDCFFVSVSLLKHPDLCGYPVAVTHAKGGSDSSHSEIASCSYQAREQGVKNGMFLGPALQLCPDLRTIPYDFDGYKSVARKLYDTVACYTLQIQAVSCDEMLVDLTDVLRETGVSSEKFAEVLRSEIFLATSCKASVGIGPSPLLAKMATKKAKPDGVFCLVQSEAEEFLSPMPAQSLPGVGRKMAKKLQDLFGTESCGDLQKLPLDRLKGQFGLKTGQMLYNSCRGHPSADEELNFDQERKSVSSEVNYGIRFNNMEECRKFVIQLSEEVCKRLEDISPNLMARALTVKLMVRAECEKGKETAKFMGHGICDSHSKSSNFASPTNDSRVITKEVLSVLNSFMTAHNILAEDLRGIGVQLSKFQNSQTVSTSGNILSLFKKASIRGEKSSSHDQPSTSTASAVGSITGASESWVRNDFSVSNIDPSVLEELPPEIRKEVEEQMEKSGTNPTITREPIPGSSTNQEKTVGTRNSEKSAYQELSFSALDPEFMAALPDELKDELQDEFEAKKQRDTTRSVTAFDRMMATASNRPSSVQNSPAGKIRKSPKNSPRFVKKSSKTSEAAAASVSKRLPLFEEDTKTKVEEELKPTEPPKHPEVLPEKANLDGARDLRDLRNLYRNWIKSAGSGGPTQDDSEYFAKFLCDLIGERDLNTVYDSLKCIRRHCMEANSENWNCFYNGLVDRLQRVMIETCGKKLYIGF